MDFSIIPFFVVFAVVYFFYLLAFSLSLFFLLYSQSSLSVPFRPFSRLSFSFSPTNIYKYISIHIYISYQHPWEYGRQKFNLPHVWLNSLFWRFYNAHFFLLLFSLQTDREIVRLDIIIKNARKKEKRKCCRKVRRQKVASSFCFATIFASLTWSHAPKKQK